MKEIQDEAEQAIGKGLYVVCDQAKVVRGSDARDACMEKCDIDSPQDLYKTTRAGSLECCAGVADADMAR